MRITFDDVDNCADNADSMHYLRDAEALVRASHLAHASALGDNRLLRRFADALRLEHDAMAKRVAAIPAENKITERYR